MKNRTAITQIRIETVLVLLERSSNALKMRGILHPVLCLFGSMNEWMGGGETNALFIIVLFYCCYYFDFFSLDKAPHAKNVIFGIEKKIIKVIPKVRNTSTLFSCCLKYMIFMNRRRFYWPFDSFIKQITCDDVCVFVYGLSKRGAITLRKCPFNTNTQTHTRKHLLRFRCDFIYMSCRSFKSPGRVVNNSTHWSPTPCIWRKRKKQTKQKLNRVLHKQTPIYS